MYSYNEKSNVLSVQKIELPVDVNVDLIKNLKDSYREFLEVELLEVLQYITDSIEESIFVENRRKSITFKLSPKTSLVTPVSSRPTKEKKKQGDKYFAIFVELYSDGEFVRHSDDHPILKIPYMDDFCVMNVEGKNKVLLSELKSLEDVSFNRKKEDMEMAIVFPTAQLRMILNPRKLYMKIGKLKVPMEKLALTMMRKSGDERSITDIITTSHYQLIDASKGYQLEETISDEMGKMGLPHLFDKKRYKMGPLRDRLNARLSIDRAVDCTLAKDVELKRTGGVLTKGTPLSEVEISKLKMNFVNEVFVKYVPEVSGKKLAVDIDILAIPEGVRVSQTLKDLLSLNVDEGILSETIMVNRKIPKGTVLTKELVQDLADLGKEELFVKKTNQPNSPVIRIPFYREVIGNYTIQIKDFLMDVFLESESLPEGMVAESYFYYYGIDEPWNNVRSVENNYLNSHDMLALMSLLLAASQDDTLQEVQNRDEDFLKKINRIKETFSEAIKSAADKWTGLDRKGGGSGNSHQKIGLMVNSNNASSDVVNGVYYNLHRKFLHELGQIKKLLVPAEDLNPVSLLSQVNRVSTFAASSNSVADTMRTLALPYYGRLDPYETPAGKKIGLTNTLAAACRVRNSIPETPYIRVVDINGKKRLANRVEYLTALDEVKFTIGDILDIELDKDGFIIPSNVTARVPGVGTADKVVIETIPTQYLNYVSAYPEQHCCSTTMLVPFAAANDGVRIQYALNLIRQSLYVQESEVPRVLTPMYAEVFNYSDTYTVRAKKSGIVIEIAADSFTVAYDDGTEDILDVPETKVTNKCYVTMNFRVNQGSRFEKGDILVDSPVSRNGFFSPGVHGFVAYMPYDGRNYEDAMPYSTRASHKLVSVELQKYEKSFKVSESTDYTRLQLQNVYPYIKRGGKIAEVSRTKKSTTAPGRKESIHTKSEQGLLYGMDMLYDKETDKKVFFAELLSFNHLQDGDKMSGRHGNKGTTSKIYKNSTLPMFLNGEHLDLVLNPCGTVSRMNVGQQLESYLGFVGYLFDIHLSSAAFNGATLDDVRDLMELVWDIANEDNFETVYAKHSGKFPKALLNRARTRLEHFRHWKGCFNKNGTAMLFNPNTGKMYENPITFGYTYMLKVDHEVDHKIHARGGMFEEEYTRMQQQPPQGSSNEGGQKLGEMEAATLAAMGATSFLYESFNHKSDHVELRTNLTLEAMGLPPMYENPENFMTKTLENFVLDMQALGVKIESDAIPDLDDYYVSQKLMPNVAARLKVNNSKMNEKDVKKLRDEMAASMADMDFDD